MKHKVYEQGKSWWNCWRRAVQAATNTPAKCSIRGDVVMMQSFMKASFSHLPCHFTMSGPVTYQPSIWNVISVHCECRNSVNIMRFHIWFTELFTEFRQHSHNPSGTNSFLHWEESDIFDSNSNRQVYLKTLFIVIDCCKLMGTKFKSIQLYMY